MSTKVVATIAAAALPMAVSGEPTITRTMFTDSDCTQVQQDMSPNPATYPADGSCVDTTYRGTAKSEKFTCDGTTATVTVYDYVADCSNTGDPRTLTLGDCVFYLWGDSYMKLTDCTDDGHADDGGDDGHADDGGDDGHDDDGGDDGHDDDGGDGGHNHSGNSSTSTTTTTTGTAGDSSSAQLTWFITAASVAAVCVL